MLLDHSAHPASVLSCSPDNLDSSRRSRLDAHWLTSAALLLRPILPNIADVLWKGSCMGKHLTREELYELVWSKPTIEVATELGISDVAIAKRCKRLNVPKPSVGYWAKVAAGKNPPKLPLPPERVITVPLEAPFEKTLPLPDHSVDLHIVAVEVRVALREAKPDANGCLEAKGPTMPRVSVSEAQVDRAAKAVHVIVTKVEERGIAFRKYRGTLEPGYFVKGSDDLDLKISEVWVRREMTLQERRRGMWQEPKAATGRLAIEIRRRCYGDMKPKIFEESDKLPLAQLLAEVVRHVCLDFVSLEKEHAEARDRMERQHAAWLVQEEVERKQRHEASLQATMHFRSEDLLKAAEWHRLHVHTVEFISACAKRWREGQSGEITPEQQTWLEWASDAARALSPFEVGYPNPARDGAFDPSSVAVDGPYPPKRDFPRPPTMPKIPAVVQASGYSYGSASETKQPSGWWLKHPGKWA